ncbi:methyltransferase (TIGR00027 family) [Nocardia tenerifensis]|uniref:S-adenosyl-L-methionine-dependent methyltransferase n=1 Tax=Nocardia tenerifensis TaxID=228006 RepID=A0A318JMM3_9NOCA|nr:class I SAM-dependent methyltransferase [Nocardia tenerifensis]PXX54076.1 methyltransferase (TIGR00027 family) [Nocardia tenerifensis]
MENDGPSRTALVTAYARAYHQIADRPPIFIDPLAAPMLGVTTDDLNELGTRTSDQPGNAVRDPARRLFFAARSRFAEDCVAAAVESGVRQVVILGAGLDTFAYRNPHPDLRVYEVDHPATQAWKRQRLAEAGIDHPETLTFVPVDFETDTLAAGLESAGFDRSDAAVFVWLGVVFYLTRDAARATLEYIAGQARPATVVFDYLRPGDTDEERAHMRARAERLAAIGEPVFSYFAPDEIAGHLRSLGFTDIEDHSAPELVAGYLDGSTQVELESADALRALRILRASR